MAFIEIIFVNCIQQNLIIMVNPTTLQQIHKLVDKADQSQLDAVLELLQPSSTRYSAEEINSFYGRVKKFEDNEVFDTMV